VGKPLPTVALDGIQVASPCHAAWDDMHGDARVRFCGSCQKNVFNLSEMTREDAEALVTNTEGRLCVRFFRREDGTVMTQDCPVGLAAVRRRLAWIGSAVAAGLAVVAAFVGLRPTRRPLMGEVSVPSTPGVAPTPQHFTTGRIALPVETKGEVIMGDMVAPVSSAE
jgi:hypothetical protein